MFLHKLIGWALLLAGLYFFGQNIYFTTGYSRYFWGGVAAKGSILSLTTGVALLFLMPRQWKFLGSGAIVLGIILVFLSGRAVLNPTSLWHFCLSLALMVGGYQLMANGRINL